MATLTHNHIHLTALQYAPARWLTIMITEFANYNCISTRILYTQHTHTHNTKKHNTIRETIIRQLIRLRYGCMRTCVCAINMHARARSACVRMRKVDWEIQCIQQKTTQKRNVVTARKCMRRSVRSSRNCERMRALADDPCSQAMVLKGVRACVVGCFNCEYVKYFQHTFALYFRACRMANVSSQSHDWFGAKRWIYVSAPGYA